MEITKEDIDRKFKIQKMLYLSGITQKEIAQELGVNINTVSRVISGKLHSSKVKQYINQLIGEEVF